MRFLFDWVSWLEVSDPFYRTSPDFIVFCKTEDALDNPHGRASAASKKHVKGIALFHHI